jgi:predicted esterase
MPEETPAHSRPDEGARHGRLTACPTVTRASVEPGVHELDGQALLYVPSSLGGCPTRLAVVLHGAGGTAGQALRWLSPQADAAGLLLLTPQAVASTWDVIVGGYGPDVARLDNALNDVFVRTTVDVAGVAVAGFSDGASYALSLGVANGDLFRAVLAFSPGFMAPMVRHGRPRFFVSHGTDDGILPIDACSRRLVPTLRESGYPVTYEEFAGGHEIPARVVASAVQWWTVGWDAEADTPGTAWPVEITEQE